MRNPLQLVEQWVTLAEKAGYRPSELAALCQISLRSLDRHFKKAYGISVAQWLREVRLFKAHEMLAAGSTAQEAALHVGYKSTNGFSSEFKTYFGLTPSDAIRLMRERKHKEVTTEWVSPPAFAIAWDPTIVDESDYSRIVVALGDLVRQCGGRGLTPTT